MALRFMRPESGKEAPMITLLEACELAAERFAQLDYHRGMTQIMDFGSAWFMDSIRNGYENEMNLEPISILIYKEDGALEMTDITHYYDQYYNGDDVEVPEIYRISSDRPEPALAAEPEEMDEEDREYWKY